MEKSSVLLFDDLELPVFPATEVLCSKQEYENAAKSGKKSFTRIAGTSGPESEKLKDRLDRVQNYFSIISELCQVKFVSHEYGVCHDNPSINCDRRRVQNILPTGYLLVAHVATIVPTGSIPQHYIDMFENGRKQYINEVISHDQNAYNDVSLKQVLYGIDANDMTSDPTLWYVDIDPLAGPQTFPIPGLDESCDVMIQFG